APPPAPTVRTFVVQPPPAARPAAPPRPIIVHNVPRPTPKPAAPVMVAVADPPKPKPQQVAALTPAPKPSPKLRSDGGEGDIGDAATPVPMGPRAWTIQIGAFADAAQARGQLAAYAEKSMDVLGQAARIVMPFTAVDGHTLYRARFGPFVER